MTRATSPYLNTIRRSVAEVAAGKPLIVDQPQPGFYKCRLVKGGPFVGVRIWWQYPTDPVTGEEIERPGGRWRAAVNGVERDPYETWTRCAHRPVSVAEYHALRHDGRDPNAPIDLTTARPVF